MFPFSPQKSASHLLILLSIIVAGIGFLFPAFSRMYGLNNWFLYIWDYGSFFVQVLLFQFLHGSILHLGMNAYFLYTAWIELEARMTQNRFWYFFMTSTIFVVIALLLFSPGTNTIGISGFCMALLSYLWMDLYTTRHPMQNQILMMLVLNIGIWFFPGISLVGHLFGAIWWIIWWFMFRNWRK